MRTYPCAVLALLALLPACSSGGDAAATLAARDSAGITIVENAAPLWEQGNAWRVSEQPRLQIGQADGPPEYAFDRVMGVARLPDGGIAVADMGSSQVRFYDVHGRFQHAVGRQGKGPREFTQIMGMQRILGDSLLVMDGGIRALLFDATGRAVRTLPLHAVNSPFTFILGQFADGAFVVEPGIRVMPGLAPDSMTILRLRSGGAIQDTFGRFPMAPQGGSRSRPRPVIFGSRPSYAVSASHLFFGYPERYEIGRYTTSGTLDVLVRRAWRPEPITEEEKEEYAKQYVDMKGEDGRAVPERLRAQRRRNLEESAFAEHRPAFTRIVLDRTDHLWVQEYSMRDYLPQGRFQPTVDEPSRWSVFDAAGRWLGQVTLAAGFRPMEIGDDYVLGLARDEDEVEYVRVYGLEKPL